MLSVCSKLSEGMTHDADEAARWLQVCVCVRVCRVAAVGSCVHARVCVAS